MKVDYQQLFQKINEYPLIDIIGQDTALKPTGANQWIGCSPFREEKNPSFSLGFKNNRWFYYDHATGDKGNIFTYLKEKYQLTKNLAIAEFLKIDIPLLSGNSTHKNFTSNVVDVSQPKVDWALQEKEENLKMLKSLQSNLSQLGKIAIEPICLIEELSEQLKLFAEKREWNYPSVETEVKGKKLSNKKHLTNKVTITAQKYKDEQNIKKWRYLIETHYEGFSQKSYLYSKDEVKAKYVSDYALGLYNQEGIANFDYLVLTEGETDCDAAIACGLNAASMPTPNLDEQVKLLKQLKAEQDNINLIIIFADNDYAGINKAYTTLKACEKVGLAAIAINPYIQKLISSNDPQTELVNARKEGQKWLNEGQGFDFRDYVNSILVKGNEIVFNRIKELIDLKCAEFTGSKQNQKTLANNQLQFSRIKLFVSEKSQLLKSLKNETRIDFILDAQDLINPDDSKLIFGFRKYLEKIGKEVSLWLNNKEIDSKRLYRICCEMQRINAQYSFTSQIEIKQMFLNGEILENALSNCSLENKLIAIKSGLGTNKTGSIGELVNSHPELKDRGTLQLSDINKLLTQTVERYNKLNKTFYHLHLDQAHDLIGDEKSNIACCFQSLMNFKSHEIEDKVIIIDESMSVIFSLLDGGTFPNSIVQQLIKQQLEVVLRSSYCVFILDGNLSNDNVSLLSNMCHKEVIKIENKLPQKKDYQLKLVADWNACIAQAIDDYRANKRVCICADSQAELRRIYKILIEKCHFDFNTIHIGDKNSTKTECPDELLADPSKYFAEHPEVKMFLYSPSMGRGFDIQGDIFHYQYGYFCGVLSIDQIDQMPFRIRSEKVERTLFIENQIGALRKVNKYTDNTKIALANQILEAVSLVEKTELGPEFINITHKYMDDALFTYGQKLDTFNGISAEDLSFSFYCFGLLKGYDIYFDDVYHKDTQIIIDTKETIKQEIAEAKEAYFKESLENIQSLDSIQDEIQEVRQHINKIENKLETPALLSQEEKQELIDNRDAYKTHLEELNTTVIKTKKQIEKIDSRFPNITKSESFKKPELITCLLDKSISDELNKQLARYYYLSLGTIPLNIIERQLYLFLKSERSSGNVWINDFNTEALLIDLLRKMNLFTLIEKYSFGNDTVIEDADELLPIADNWNSNLLGDRPSSKIKQLRNVLKYVGYDVHLIKRDRRTGTRLYSIVPILMTTDQKKDLDTNYPIFTQFYSDLINGIAIKLSQRKKYPVNWDKLPEVESFYDPDLSIDIDKMESVGLINNLQSSFDVIIKTYRDNVSKLIRSESIQLNGIEYERTYFENNLIVDVASQIIDKFWEVLNKYPLQLDW